MHYTYRMKQARYTGYKLYLKVAKDIKKEKKKRNKKEKKQQEKVNKKEKIKKKKNSKQDTSKLVHAILRNSI